MKVIDEIDEETLRSRIEDDSDSESDSDDHGGVEEVITRSIMCSMFWPIYPRCKL